ncbi:MAG: type II secretion system F family protein [Candidatus Altiarchaeota archaeon]|nr:type II secretion system F family protein [Candidatus Altiarchaeota archaeon]
MAYYTFAIRFLPKKVRQNFKQMIDYSSIQAEADDFLGFIVTFGFIFSCISAYITYALELTHPIIGFMGSFLALEFFFYLFVSFSIDSKTKAVEEALPDALQLMSSNIRAGLTTDKALLLAARPEFGPLSDELRRVGRETMTGRNFAYALMKTTKRIKSENLNRTIDLIINSLKSGGKLADLLDQTANDLRDQEMIKKEISAGVLMYVIFIFVAIALGAPLLFAMSSFLVKLLTKNMAMISEGMPSGEAMAGAPISLTTTSLDPGFINSFSIISLVVTSLFGSIIMGLILKGDNKSGFKYLPALLIIAVGLFLLGSYAMDTIFGGMMDI